MKSNQVSLINYKIFSQGLWLLNSPQKKLLKRTSVLPIAFLLFPGVAQAQSVLNDYPGQSRNLSNQKANLFSKTLIQATSDPVNWGLVNYPEIMIAPMAGWFMPVDLFGTDTQVIESNGITGGLPRLWVSATDIDNIEIEENYSQLTFLLEELDTTKINHPLLGVETGVYRSLISGAKFNQFNLWVTKEPIKSDTESMETFIENERYKNVEKNVENAESLDQNTFFPGLVLEGDRTVSSKGFSLFSAEALTTNEEVMGRKFSVNNFAGSPEDFSPVMVNNSLMDREGMLSEELNDRLSNQQNPSATPVAYQTLMNPETPHIYIYDTYEDSSVQQPTHPLTWNSPSSWQVRPEIPSPTQTYIDNSAINDSDTLIRPDRQIPEQNIEINTDRSSFNQSEMDRTSPPRTILNNPLSWNGLPTDVTSDRTVSSKGFSLSSAEALTSNDPVSSKGFSLSSAEALTTNDRLTEIATAASWQNSVVVESPAAATTEEFSLPSFSRSSRMTNVWNGLSTNPISDRPPTDSASLEISQSWQSSAIEPSWSDRQPTNHAEINSEVEPESFSNDRINFEPLKVEPLEDSFNIAEFDRAEENSEFPASTVALAPPPNPPVFTRQWVTGAPISPVAPTLDVEFPRESQSVKNLLSINSDYLNSPVSNLSNQRTWSEVYSSLIDRDLQESLAAIATVTNSQPGVLYVLPFGDSLEIMFLSPGQPIVRRIVYDANGEQLNATVQELIAEVTNPRTFGSDDYLNPSQQLYQWLIAPIEGELQAQGIDTLMFALDPSIRSLPIAVLHDGQQFLVEKYRLSLIPSLNLTDLSYRNLNNSAVLAMGASQFADPKIQPLDQVSIELSAIGQNRSGQVFMNEAFTPENLQFQSDRGSYGIVHLATHVEFNPQQEQNSYIQFWNSRLTLDQMQEIGWQNQSLDLLVMSGCETAFGSQNVELGFAGLAVQNGVKSVLASLWQVDDRGTLGLMSEFYRHLNAQDQTIKAEALRQAQLAMLQGNIWIENGQLAGLENDARTDSQTLTAEGWLNEHPENKSIHSSDSNLAHPYFWAAFTLVGNPW